MEEIAVNLDASDQPKIKVSKGSVRDRLTLLQQKNKAKFIENKKAAMGARSLQDDNKLRKLKRQQRRSTATEPLSVWVRAGKGRLRNKTNKPRRRGKGRRSPSEVVQFLKEKSERVSMLGKEDLQLRRGELSQKEYMMKILAQQQQEQNQLMLCLLANGQNKNS